MGQSMLVYAWAVTEYLDPRDIWTPGPKFFEIFGPPLKYFIPHGFMNSNKWTGLDSGLK